MRRRSKTRLLEKTPVVYIAPGAVEALGGDQGLLLGSQRPGWVDVLAFEARAVRGYRALVDLRFQASKDWDVVGLALKATDAHRWRSGLIEGLVPGDVVLAVAPKGQEPAAYVHVGDALAPARLKISRSKPITSARRGRPRR